MPVPPRRAVPMRQRSPRLRALFTTRALALLALWAAVGGPAQAQTFTRVFDEPFSNNSRGWASQDDELVTARVTGGYYEFAYRGNGGQTIAVEAPMDRNMDYTVQATIERQTGPDGGAYGITWGGAGGDGYFFVVTGTGRLLDGQMVAGAMEALVGWATSPHIHREGTNLLGVYRQGAALYLYVNEELVASTTAAPLFGTEVGFWVGPGVSMRADYLVVGQPAEEPAVAASVPAATTTAQGSPPLFDEAFGAAHLEALTSSWEVATLGRTAASSFGLAGGALVLEAALGSPAVAYTPVSFQPDMSYLVDLTLSVRGTGDTGFGVILAGERSHIITLSPEGNLALLTCVAAGCSVDAAAEGILEPQTAGASVQLTLRRDVAYVLGPEEIGSALTLLLGTRPLVTLGSPRAHGEGLAYLPGVDPASNWTTSAFDPSPTGLLAISRRIRSASIPNGCVRIATASACSA